MGNVKSLNYHRKWIQKNLIPQNSKGYLFVRLSKHWEAKKWQVHRLVMTVFIDNLYQKKEVNHKNGVKIDNRLENLEWCTRSENMRHADTNKLRVMPKWEKAWWYWKRGWLWYNAKKIRQYNTDGSFICIWDSMIEASQSLSIWWRGISWCCRGIYKTAGGFIWKYK